MKVDVIASDKRGVTENEWLRSMHTYSFGKYHNLARINFGPLRVFNDDVVKPGKGFSTHSHDNMEIVTIVLEGSLRHQDDKGNEGVLKSGDVQRMSAGTGIAHSEMNASSEEEVHFLQVWIYPEERDLVPSYEQKQASFEEAKGRLLPIVSEKGGEQVLSIHQDATFWMGEFDEKQKGSLTLGDKRKGVYFFVIEGSVQLGGNRLHAGDSAEVTATDSLTFQAIEPSKVLLIELNLVRDLH